jgi:MoxR-like ATPase
MTVDRVWRNPGVQNLVELSLEGPYHTYVAQGLGTHNCNALSPQLQKSLNAISDFRRKIEVPEAKRVFKLVKGAELWVVGTMNLAIYGGTYALNEDLKSRFNLLPLDYPEIGKEKKIMLTILEDLVSRLPTGILDSVMRFALQTRQGELDYALSPRDVVQLLTNVDAIGLAKALWIVTGKFDDEDRDTVKKWIQSIFGVMV